MNEAVNLDNHRRLRPLLTLTDEEQSGGVVEQHFWENIFEDEKEVGRYFRKATSKDGERI